MDHPYADALQAGLEAVRSAAAICQAVQKRFNPDRLDKSDKSPVTIADFASQAVICKRIREQFPNDPIIAEEDSYALRQPENQHFIADVESVIKPLIPDATPEQIFKWIDFGDADQFSSRFWTLDPIDGTKGFLRGGQYAVSLALIVDGKIQLGILACPNLAADSASGKTLFYAVRGYGSYAGDLNPATAFKQIQVSDQTDPAAARFCESFESGHSSHDESVQILSRLQNQSTPTRMDSQAKYAMVAQGDADIYLRLPTKTGYFEKIWDHAGGVLVVQEAGGVVTDTRGASLDFCQGRELKKNRGVIVSNGHFHDVVLETLSKVLNPQSD